MATMAKLSSNDELAIPKEVRDAQAWRTGQEFVFVPKGRGVLILPAPMPEDLVGIARGASPDDYRDRDDRA